MCLFHCQLTSHEPTHHVLQISTIAMKKECTAGKLISHSGCRIDTPRTQQIVHAEAQMAVVSICCGFLFYFIDKQCGLLQLSYSAYTPIYTDRAGGKTPVPPNRRGGALTYAQGLMLRDLALLLVNRLKKNTFLVNVPENGSHRKQFLHKMH